MRRCCKPDSVPASATIDELRGRREASRRHLHFIGTLGVLRIAGDQGLLDFRQAIARLQSTNFHIEQKLLDRLMQKETE